MNAILQCLSHSPLKGSVDPDASIVTAVNQVIGRLQSDLTEFSPDVIFFFGPDHYNGLFLDLMPTFCIGLAATSVGDYYTSAGPLRVPVDLAQACANYVMTQDIDVAVSRSMFVDHGVAQPLEELTGALDRYDVVPIIINSVAPPLASFRRARQLGEAVGRFALKTGKRCAFIGSGGLSHSPPVPQYATAPKEVREFLIAGRNPTPEARAARQQRTQDAARAFASGTSTLPPLNPDWDKEFIDKLTCQDWPRIDAYDNAKVTAEAGASTHEVKTWVAAHAAMSAFTAQAYETELRYYKAIPEWIAGFGVMAGRESA